MDLGHCCVITYISLLILAGFILQSVCCAREGDSRVPHVVLSGDHAPGWIPAVGAGGFTPHRCVQRCVHRCVKERKAWGEPPATTEVEIRSVRCKNR